MREYLFQRPIDLLAMERDAIHAIEFGGSWVKRMEWKGKERKERGNDGTYNERTKEEEGCLVPSMLVTPLPRT